MIQDRQTDEQSDQYILLCYFIVNLLINLVDGGMRTLLQEYVNLKMNQ